jgi:sporulation protein YlmC with PRC-barrel domain
MTGRVVLAGLDLLDRQIVDRDGKLAGKVDDLELLFPEDGGAPYVTAILSGPGALARRLGGRLGRWIGSVHGRLHPHAEPTPARISFGVVKRIEDHIELTIGRDGLESMHLEDWVSDHIMGRIPGARHASE